MDQLCKGPITICCICWPTVWLCAGLEEASDGLRVAKFNSIEERIRQRLRRLRRHLFDTARTLGERERVLSYQLLLKLREPIWVNFKAREPIIKRDRRIKIIARDPRF